ncbi:MAG TPA: carbon-nitrogen hydrolase family protein [Gemmataceae bacterium]|nr:carbon-nitrogen hydrolase family protein [Gemmataceae bacterium]
MRVAAVQLNSGPERGRNLAAAGRLVAAAAADGARLVVLPETFNCLGPPEVLRAGAEPFDGPTLAWAKEAARGHGLWLAAGSFLERVADGPRCFNTACLLNPRGEVVAAYRKVHLFDCELPGAELRESDVMRPGGEVVTAEAAGLPLGLAICYDLRFPELFRALAVRGARAVAFPSAFTARTGPDHWEVLLRARAIENQAFVIAADQCGESGPGLRWHGHSMVVDAWGRVLAEVAEGEGYAAADLDLAAQEAIRERMPCLRHRRPDVYCAAGE